jgi:hypothetical protein
MALTKARTSLYAAQVLTAGAGDTTSAAQNISAAYGGLLDITLTNGATGPTVAAQVRVQVANDTSGTLWTDLTTFVAGTANNGVYFFSVELPIGAQAFRLISGSNITNNVTLNADFSLVTGL